MDQCEKEIIYQLKKGDEEAYKYLYDKHYVLLCQYANEILQDSFQAETVVNDVIFHLWEIRSSLQITTSLRSYLIRSVRNRSLNYLNSDHQKKVVRFSVLEEEGVSYDLLDVVSNINPLGTLLVKEKEDVILRSINSLSPECKAVFMKSRFEQKSYEEIAHDLGISVNTVKYHIKKALSSLHTSLDRFLFFLLLFLLN